MFLSRIRIPAALPRSCSKAVVAIAFAGLVAGCSARQQYGSADDVAVAGGAQQVASGPVREEMEDDGLPAQRPPLQRHAPVRDDPSEPFSPNYGAPSRQAASRQAALERPTRVAIPDDLPADFRRRLIVANGDR